MEQIQQQCVNLFTSYNTRAHERCAIGEQEPRTVLVQDPEPVSRHKYKLPSGSRTDDEKSLTSLVVINKNRFCQN
ncbi:uncharacterized [Tachysurus ichikawai]